MLLSAALVCRQAQAASIDFGVMWSTNLNATIAVTNISATAGTTAAVAFGVRPAGVSFSAGGVYNSFTPTTLGATTGSFISLKFTTSFTSGGVATNLNRKFSFGLAGVDDKLFGITSSGASTGTKLTLGGYIDTPGTVVAGYLYRGDIGSPVTNSISAFTGTYTNGPDAALNTTYTLTLTRTATGANLDLSQIKPGNNWTSTFTFTTAQANAITLDKVFFGLNGSVVSADYMYTVSDLSVQVYIPPVKRVSLSVLTSPN